MHSKKTGAALLVAFALALAAGTASALSVERRAAPSGHLKAPTDRAGIREIEDAVVEAVAAVRPAVVHISVARTVNVTTSPLEWDPFGGLFGRRYQMPHRSEGMGSGVIVSPDGYIITNHHVVGSADEIEVMLYDGRVLPAKLVGTDQLTDVAVIKIGGKGHPHAEFADSDDLRVGQFAIAIGNPFGLDHTVTLGIVSARGRRGIVGAGGSYEDFIQTDVAINPGNSGGPLVDLEGKVIGINSAIFSRSGGYQGIGFAIPANLAKTIMDRLVKVGYVERAWLGVVLQDMTADLAAFWETPRSGGALIAQVIRGSPAARAGLQVDDVVVSVAGKRVRNSGDLRNRVAHTPVGETIEIEYVRDGRRRTAHPKLAAHPAHRPVHPPATREAEDEDHLSSGRIGIKVRPITRREARELGYPDADGLIMTRVYPDGSAAEAGLVRGEVILRVNRKPVNSYEDFGRVLKGRKPGEPLLFLVRNRMGARYVVLK